MAKLLSFQNTKPMYFSTERSPSPHRPWTWRKFFGKDHGSLPPAARIQPEEPKDDVSRRRPKKVIPGLPRPGTFRRQQSELRENLEPVKPFPHERRALSVDPGKGESFRGSSRISVPSLPRTSAPGLLGTNESTAVTQQERETIAEAAEPEPVVEDIAEQPPQFNDVFDDDLEEELEKRWILNLSMHFRDRSNREKFFVTFAETPTHWRRVTVSVDYRDASPNSLELELQHTQYQRDKSAKIYEAIRDSLPDIQFYETVTNLKLATENERLHVHVTEDINEVIHFPPVSAVGHLNCLRVKEKDVEFDSHLSGFVYKVNVGGYVFIKKEIPGPDTVEEFLYEVNALHRLSDSDSVIHFGGVITDNEGRHLKGLLISYAEQGALIDVLYDGRGELSWPRRERWAKQIVQGLSEIHEAGFVQGDFTLSNIVIDGDDMAKIIDINRRGCPVGWEPPEVAALIESKQRIAMYIGVKSDIFQLGMVLWAIAMQQDEPDIQTRPLTLHSAPVEVPSYYRDLVHICLSDDPKHRRNTSYLLDLFPDLDESPQLAPDDRHLEAGEHQYIDPATAVNREDIERFRRLASPSAEHPNMDIISTGSHTYVNPPTDTSGEAYFFPTRGRSPTRFPLEETEHRHSSHFSPLDVSREADAEDLASPEGEPIVVDVSPERRYLSREAPSTIDVAYAEVGGAVPGIIKPEDDDASIDLNDAARASLEEYRHRHEGLVQELEPAEFLSNQVYQPPVGHFDRTEPRPEECAYTTPPHCGAGDDLDLQQSYDDMGETAYFDPIMAVPSHRESVGPGLVTPAPCEVDEFVTPLVDASGQASVLDTGSEMPQQHEGDNLRFAEIADGKILPAHIVLRPAVGELETQRPVQQFHNEVVHAPSAAGAAAVIAGTRSLNLEQNENQEVVPSLSHEFIVGLETELAQAPVDVPEVIYAKPPAEQLVALPARGEDRLRVSEPEVLVLDTINDGEFKVEGRVDSGFANHYDPDSPTTRKMEELRACRKTEPEAA